MTVLVSDVDLTIHVGDALEVLRAMPDGSVNCCATSPPYWGLRDYGTGAWDGGDPGCDHAEVIGAERTHWANSVPGPAGATAKNAKGRNETKERGGSCGKCGAARVDRQLGLEATPEEYVANMVAVFREVRRVLADDGTLWLNLGDSYNGYPANITQGGPLSGRNQHARAYRPPGYGLAAASLKPKDLCGIPWMVAFALRADGWYLRSDIIWAKPNPMPESVTDRPTKAHEYVFLLSKSPRYFFDQEAVREPHESTRWGGRLHTQNPNGKYTPESDVRIAAASKARVDRPSFDHYPNGGRNIRSVWEIATQPYAGAHFATWPEALAERIIKAGCPPGGTVLDPFGGAGTTALVARRHGRKAVLIELNPEYAALAADRCSQLSLLAEVAQ